MTKLDILLYLLKPGVQFALDDLTSFNSRFYVDADCWTQLQKALQGHLRTSSTEASDHNLELLIDKDSNGLVSLTCEDFSLLRDGQAVYALAKNNGTEVQNLWGLCHVPLQTGAVTLARVAVAAHARHQLSLPVPVFAEMEPATWPPLPAGSCSWLDVRQVMWPLQQLQELDAAYAPHLVFRETQGNHFAKLITGTAKVVCVHVAGILDSESLKLLLVQRPDLPAVGDVPVVHGYFFPSTRRHLDAHLAQGPGVILHRQATRNTDFTSWRATYQPTSPHGVPLWENNVTSEVNLLQIEPRFQYMCRPNPEGQPACSESQDTGSSSSDAEVHQQLLQEVVPCAAVPLIIRQTKEKGLGVFAGVELAAADHGVPLCCYAGREYAVHEAPRVHTYYQFNARANRDIMQLNRQAILMHHWTTDAQSRASSMTSETSTGSSSQNGPGRCKTTVRMPGPRFVVDAMHYGNVGRFFNHSCQPNCFVLDVENGDGPDEPGTLVIFTKGSTKIESGKELTIDYTIGDKRHALRPGHRWLLPCKCGHEACKGYVFPQQALLNEDQNE